MSSRDLITRDPVAYNDGDWDLPRYFVTTDVVHHNKDASLDIH